MKKNLLSIGLLAAGFAVNAQMTTTPSVLTHVDNGGLFYVGKGALVYNGGGLQTKDTGILENHGNVMVVGNATTDVLRTLAGTADKAEGATVGGTIVNKINELNGYASPNTLADGNVYSYGQLYISGLSQANIAAIVNQEHKQVKHGAYQQVAMPFYNKTFSTLSSEFGKNFTTQRWSQNEILVWSNEASVFYHLTNLATKSTQAASSWHYWVLGGAGLDPTVLHTIKGVPYAEENTPNYQLKNAAANVNFGVGGNNINSQNEKYNTYVQDGFEIANGGTAWIGNYGKNMYLLSNPYLTNIDLSRIGYAEPVGGTTPITDNVALSNIMGIRLEVAGGVTWNGTTGTSNTGVTHKFVTFANGANQTPVGDLEYLIVRPMGTFLIKLKDNLTQPTLDFKNLRRFNYIPRAETVSYSVTAAKAATGTSNNGKPKNSPATATVKQLGVIGLDAEGNEIARTYYVVYPDGKTGHTTASSTQITATSNDIMGTYEESLTGGIDPAYQSSYWLRINEANEVDFKGKAIPMSLYGNGAIKSLKFQIRENAQLVAPGTKELSGGIPFYFATETGSPVKIAHDAVVPVDGTQYSLYYGAPAKGKGANKEVAGEEVAKPARTMVVFNPSINDYIVRFDPSWKNAEVQVYDMSGKLVISEKDVDAGKDYVIKLSNQQKSTYVVTVVSDKGEKVSSKILK